MDFVEPPAAGQGVNDHILLPLGIYVAGEKLYVTPKDNYVPSPRRNQKRVIRRRAATPRLRRGSSVDGPRRRRSYNLDRPSTGRGAAAATTWIVRRRVTAPPPRRPG